ncbi:MAG: DUF1223 domain-containing protein [Erythrobacter sp.]
MSKAIFAVLAGSVALAAITLFVPGRGSAQAEHEQTGALGEPVLLELFTSQGCSSCPPADQLAERLASEEDLVVIARPVTYWDRLGWRDTLAREENTDLQRDYARSGLAGYNGVYTPQLVVDGAIGEVGSYERDVRQNIALARGSQQAAIRVAETDNGGVRVGLGGVANDTAELMLMAVSRSERVAIGRGENGGRNITYTNVLIDERVLARWDGGKRALNIAPSQLRVRGANRYALVLREPNGGEVLAARWIP